MGRFDIPEHPDIDRTERYGYPGWIPEETEEDADRVYEERRELELFGDN